TLVQFAGGAQAALQCSGHCARLPAGGRGFARKEQRLLEWRAESAPSFTVANRHIAIGAAGKRIALPVVQVGSFELQLARRQSCENRLEAVQRLARNVRV